MAATGSFIQVSPAQVILAGMKKAEDSQDLVLRLYESQGKKATARLRFFRPPQEVHRADIMEKSQGRIKTRGKQVEVKIAANEIVTLLVKF